MARINPCPFKTDLHSSLSAASKARNFIDVFGTAEAVPFQNIEFLDGFLELAHTQTCKEAAPRSGLFRFSEMCEPSPVVPKFGGGGVSDNTTLAGQARH
jgi:hypothetical protein